MPAEEDALLAYEEEVERHVLREWLWNVLDDLPEGQRLVVMLRHFGRDRYQGAATRLARHRRERLKMTRDGRTGTNVRIDAV